MVGSADRTPTKAQTLARIATVMVVLVGVLVGTASPAGACTCAGGPISERLEQADGAFIGTFVGVHPDAPARAPVGDHLLAPDELVFTFEVHKWIKADRSPGPIDLVASVDGSCGLFLAPGAEVAMLVWMRDGQPNTGTCSFVDQDELAGTTVAPRTDDAPAVFLAAPGWPDAPVLLSADGAVVGVRPDGVHGRRHASCGDGTIAEERNREVAVVDLATFDDVEVLRFRRGAARLLCNSQWLLGVAERDGELEVFDIRTRRSVAPLAENAAYVGLSAGRLTMLGPSDESAPVGWRVVDLATGEVEYLAAFDPDRQIDSLELSPGGDLVAYTGADGLHGAYLALLDVRSGAELRHTLRDNAVVKWLDDDRLFVSGGESSDPPTVRSAKDLSVLAELDPHVAGSAELVGDDTLLAADGGTVVTSDLLGGPAIVRNQLPFAVAITALPESLTVEFAWEPLEALDTPIPSPTVEALPVSSVDFEALIDPADHLAGRLGGDIEDAGGVAEAASEGGTETPPPAAEAVSNSGQLALLLLGLGLVVCLAAVVGWRRLWRT